VRLGLIPALPISLAAVACTPPDPKAHLEIAQMETYWAVDSARGDTQYLAPVVRFRLYNKTSRTLRAVDAQAAFARVGETNVDQNKWPALVIVVTGRKPLAPGAFAEVELKSEGRYTMRDTTPEGMLENEGFKDARAEIYLREGSSPWVKMDEVPVDRRIGSRAAVIPTVPLSPEP
jgi:hypothetical protein